MAEPVGALCALCRQRFGGGITLVEHPGWGAAAGRTTVQNADEMMLSYSLSVAGATADREAINRAEGKAIEKLRAEV